jgi:hypothetical protein
MDVFGEVAPALPPTPPEEPLSLPSAPPDPEYEEPVFDKVDTETWDSNWDEGWADTAAVFATSDSTHVPEAVQDDVDWSGDSENTSQKDGITVVFPTEAAMKRMKKGELVALAEEHGADSSGTKADIIARLLS